MSKKKKSQKNNKKIAEVETLASSATTNSETEALNDENVVEEKDVSVANDEAENAEQNLEAKTEKTAETESENKSKKTKGDKKSDKNDKNNKKSKKEVKEKGKFKRKAKETLSELKKVTWPTFGDVCKKTGVVLTVVLVFAVVIFGIDYCLGLLMNLLKG